MAEIDVSDIALDPMIAGDKFDVIRRQEIVGTNGLATEQRTTYRAVKGSVQPVGDQSLLREESYSTQASAIQVITGFRLRGAAKDDAGRSWLPDLVVFQGDTYMVHVVNEWTQFGGGLVAAECMSFKFIDNPPG